ncbi:MAG: lysylphosphatidylglycerol synthase transmembrane domain-containing protein [Candidatus Limnocylindria bacterium]
MTLTRRTVARALLGVAVSVAAIWILLGAVDIGAALEVLGSASPAWVLVMVGSVMIDVAARGRRWQALLGPVATVAYRRVLGYTYLGYLANNVLPARLGELVRSHALGEGEGVSRTTVLGTVVVERIVDTVIVVALAAGTVVLLSVGGAMATGVLLGTAFVAVLVSGLAGAIALHRLPGADRFLGLAGRWPRVVDLAARLRTGLAVAAHPRALGLALVLSAVAWTASIVTILAAGRAVGIELSFAQGALLSSGIALATIVPSGPGYLGTFELTAVGIASAFGIGPDRAFAMALLVHALILGVTSVGGVAALIAGRRRRSAPERPRDP